MGASTRIDSFLPALAKVGDAHRVGRVHDEKLYAELLQSNWLNHVSPGTWRSALSESTEIDLENIFRALVILERDGHWVGGSVASTVWLFQLLREHVSEAHSFELADWALKNRGRNTYTPFGHRTFATSLREYRVEQQEKARRRRAQDSQSQADQAAARQRRAGRQEAHAARQAATARRSTKLRSELRQLMSKPPPVRLAAIAHGALPLEMIESDWIDRDVLEQADDKTLRALIVRIDKRAMTESG